MKRILVVSLVIVNVVLGYAQDSNHRKLDAKLALLRTAGKDTLQVNLLNEIAAHYWSLNGKVNRDSIFYYANKGLLLARELDYKKGMAESLFHLGRYHIASTRKMAEATPNLLESLATFEEINDSAGISKCYLQLGVISFSMQYYEDAIRKNQLAILYKPNPVSKYLMAIGYAELDSIDAAMNYFRQAMHDYAEEGNQGRLVECHMYLGKMFIQSGRFDSGFHYLTLAIDSIRAKKDSTSLGRPYAFLSKAYLLQNNLENALDYARRSYQIGKKNSDEITILESVYTLSRVYALKHDYTNAYKYLNELFDLKESVYRGGIKQKVADMQSKFDYEKKLNNQKEKREREMLISQQAIQKEKAVRNSLLLCAVLLLGLLIVLYNRFMLKRRANFDLEEKNKIILLEKERSDNLLLNILPIEVAEELKRTGESVARQYNHVTVLFTDFINFTGASEKMSPTELVHIINQNFTAFDAIIEKHGLEKIKTIGDAYLAVCGMPNEFPDHAIRVIRAAIDIQYFIQHNNSKFQVRIGVHSGPVVAGIVGVKKFAYDIWGDTVNTAARMEQNSEPGKINLSGTTHDLVKDLFTCIYRGKIEAKNKGEIDMYFVKGES